MKLTHKNAISPATYWAKRSFDIIVSILGLIVVLPLFPVIALLIKLESKGDVFFTQLRIGLATPEFTHMFNMIKFRTMAQNAEQVSGAVWAGKNDCRITRVGKFLRKTRLDELPQLFNVLKGDMSVIGPRPERPGFYKKLDLAIPYFADRTYYVYPGITGLAQVNQGYDTCIEDVRRKVGFDHSYAMALTHPVTWFKMDIWIAVNTIKVMVLGRGQ